MNATSATVGPEVDEFELAGLSGTASAEVTQTGWSGLR